MNFEATDTQGNDPIIIIQLAMLSKRIAFRQQRCYNLALK